MQVREWIFGEDWGFRSLDGSSSPGSASNRDSLARFAIVMSGGFIALGTMLLLLIAASGSEVPGLHMTAALVSGVSGLLLVVPMWIAFHRVPLGALHFIVPVTSGILVAVGVAVGPTLETAVVLGLVIIVLVIAVAMRFRVALLHMVPIAIAYGIVLRVNHASAPVARMVGTMGGALLVAGVVEWLVGKTRDVARAERVALASAELARTELADLNATLEARVGEQVADLERLGQLQRFLPSALVDAVLSDSQQLLEPHRAEVAVLFCDLRGFTAFTASSPPEEVHELLEAYFARLGELAQRHGATIGAFTGDGLMAFFNDPLPVPDPALRALDLALALQEPVGALLAPWRRVGHDIGFAVGIALGYANIGMIGFEGRRDYTALGPVVNLAARLCAEAPADVILLDPRARVAVEGCVALGEPIFVHLKGFERTVEAVPVIPNGALGRPIHQPASPPVQLPEPHH